MRNFASCRRVFLALAGLVGLMGSAAVSQVTPETKPPVDSKPKIDPQGRPRIGLVLEGGGALGLAHIGVIQWMEDHHIPVDYVAGTSMGGLVGGLYASGLTTGEMKEFVDRIDWASVLSGQVPFQALSFRRKEDKLAFPNRLEFGLKGGRLRVPNGLNSGAAVGLLFDRTVLPYYDLQSFDDLPIPFRCVATEIISGQPHVFKDGSLAQALRATMSIPGVFAPVHHGDLVFSDGAAVDNLPVDVARDMGANVVIASYLDSGPTDPGSLGSLVGVAGRNVSIMVAANVARSLQNADIVISSDVSKFGTLEFSRSDDLIPIGVKSAEMMSERLKKYALNDADWAEYMQQRQARRRTKVPVPQFIEIYGIKGARQQEMDAKFERFIGKPIDLDRLEDTIADVEGTGLYSTINFNLVDRDGKHGLLIRPREKDHGPPFMNLGLTILANDSNNVQFGMALRATFFDLVGPGSELRVDGAVGQPAGLGGELFRPFKAGGRAFVAPHAYLTHQVIPYYQGSTQLDQYRQTTNGLGADLGFQFNARTEVRVGQDYQWYSAVRTIGTPIGNEFHLRPFVSAVKFQYLGQDDMMVPTRGTIAAGVYNYYTQRPNGSGGYSQMTGRLQHFIPIKSRGILLGTMEGGTSFGADNLGLAGVSLGGPLRLSAYSRDELLGTDYFFARAGYLYRLGRLNPVIGDALYAGGIYEIGKMYGANAQTPSLPYSVTGAVVVKTLIGPLFGGLSVGDGGRWKWYFGLGRVF
ncbi:MAG TPA: patatin-like phospholipase family protein [Edaphobacter sp.]